eukprot:c21242_g1_i1 orf=468-2240(+)
MVRATLLCGFLSLILLLISCHAASEADQGAGNRPGVEIRYGDASSKALSPPLIVNSNANTKPTPRRVSVSTVALLTLAMAAASGLGAVPFFFMDLQAQWAGICNGIAAGVMLAASFDLVQEGQKYGGGTWVVLGIVAGGFFILCCQKFLERYGEVSMLDIKGADAKKMMLVIGIMTLHSFGEGSGVGVSFAGSRGLPQGVMVTIAIAVHNIPEGLAVSMVLASRGVSARSAMLWSIFTSLPQPLVAVPAFMCAEAFQKFLPSCMGFAAGCMIWMVLAEVVPDSFKEAHPQQVASAATLAVAFMESLSTAMENFDEVPRWESMTAFVVSLLFGLGPFLGGIVLVTVSGSIKLSQSFLTGTSTGISLVLLAWRPLQLWWGGKMSALFIGSLFCIGSFLYHAVENVVCRTMSQKLVDKELICPMPLRSSVSLVSSKALLACGAVGLHAFAEGLALGVAAPKAYGLGRHMLLPVSLHGLPRGAAVASATYGAMGSWRTALTAAAVTGFAGPLAAIGAIITGIDYNGLDYWMVIACGALLPAFAGDLFRRALKLHSASAVYGLFMGLGFANICLASTKLVCLHTPYCNSAPEAVT